MSKRKLHPRAWGQRGRGRNAGIIGSQARDPELKKNAKFHWYARQQKKFLNLLESDSQAVKDQARQLLMDVYGCDLPHFVHEELTDYKAPNPKKAPHWMTSKDQRELMMDATMLTGAVSNDWPLSKGFKETTVLRLHSIINNPLVSPELVVKVAQVAAKLDATNVARQAAMNPQKHEHVHVQLKPATADERRTQILDLLNGELARRSLPEPHRESLGDGDVIDVPSGEQPA